jgi:hypothetical protein
MVSRLRLNRKFKMYKGISGLSIIEVLVICSALTMTWVYFMQGSVYQDQAFRTKFMSLSWYRLVSGIFLMADNNVACTSSLNAYPYDGTKDLDLGSYPSSPSGIQYVLMDPNGGAPTKGGYFIKKGVLFENLLYVQDIFLKRALTTYNVPSSTQIKYYTHIFIRTLKKTPALLDDPNNPALSYRQIKVPVVITVDTKYGYRIYGCSGIHQGIKF